MCDCRRYARTAWTYDNRKKRTEINFAFLDAALQNQNKTAETTTRRSSHRDARNTLHSQAEKTANLQTQCRALRDLDNEGCGVVGRELEVSSRRALRDTAKGIANGFHTWQWVVVASGEWGLVADETARSVPERDGPVVLERRRPGRYTPFPISICGHQLPFLCIRTIGCFASEMENTSSRRNISTQVFYDQTHTQCFRPHLGERTRSVSRGRPLSRSAKYESSGHVRPWLSHVALLPRLTVHSTGEKVGHSDCDNNWSIAIAVSPSRVVTAEPRRPSVFPRRPKGRANQR